MKTKILFLTHKIDDQIINEFENIKRTGLDIALVHNGEKNDSIPTPNYCFTAEDIWEQYYPAIDKEIITYQHLVVLNFYQNYSKKYDYYWAIEYDVRFTGDWVHFFSQFDKNSADFITSHIRHYHEEPGWLGWEKMKSPPGKEKTEDYLRSFNPIYRISKEALEYIDKQIKAGYAGHNEVLFPTLIYHNDDLKMTDFGGSGTFVEGAVNKNYISRSDKDGEIFGGTFRFRPTMNKIGMRKNKLYHPIKSDSENNYIGLLKFADKYFKNLFK
jgi:hypothetical protein